MDWLTNLMQKLIDLDHNPRVQAWGFLFAIALTGVCAFLYWWDARKAKR